MESSVFCVSVQYSSWVRSPYTLLSDSEYPLHYGTTRSKQRRPLVSSHVASETWAEQIKRSPSGCKLVSRWCIHVVWRTSFETDKVPVGTAGVHDAIPSLKDTLHAHLVGSRWHACFPRLLRFERNAKKVSHNEPRRCLLLQVTKKIEVQSKTGRTKTVLGHEQLFLKWPGLLRLSYHPFKIKRVAAAARIGCR